MIITFIDTFEYHINKFLNEMEFQAFNVVMQPEKNQEGEKRLDFNQGPGTRRRSRSARPCRRMDISHSMGKGKNCFPQRIHECAEVRNH